MNSKELSIKFFEFLKDNFEHVVVGDVRGFPEEIVSDIDIVVNSGDFDVFKKKLLDFCKEQEILLVQSIKHEQSANYLVISKRLDDGKLFFLHPDICHNYYRNGKLFLPANKLLKDKNAYNGLPVPRPAVAFIYYFLKRIDKEELAERHIEYLSLQWKLNPNGCYEKVLEYFGNNEATVVREAFEKEDYTILSSNLKLLKKSLHSKLPFSLGDYFSEFKRIIMRVLRPTGLMIGFLGPDGSGKSTIAKRVIHDLEPVFRGTRQYHLRPFFIKKSKNSSPVQNPHSNTDRSFLMSVVKLFYWSFDYIAGYVFRIYLQLIQSTLVVFDRYYHDLLVDPKRYRYNAPQKLAVGIGKLIPKPDLFILFDAPAKKLHERKSEVTIEESRRQRKEYQKLVQNMSNGYIIDASQSVQRVTEDVEDIIFNYLSERTTSRLK